MTEATLGEAASSSEGEREAFKRRLLDHLTHTVGKDGITATPRDWFMALARTVRDQLVESWMDSTRTLYHNRSRRIYYLSLEFLIGRSLINNLANTGFLEVCRDSLAEMGLDLDAVAAQEPEAALGNGGLGRLAACLMDAMATVGIPGYGYGIRYDYGMFSQYLEDGAQVEMPEHWLRHGNPWEFSRPEVVYPVKFHGRLLRFKDERGVEREQWVEANEVLATAYDQPVVGFGAWSVNNIRLWSARPSTDFDLRRFNRGDYLEAVRGQMESGTLSRVLYPDDSTWMGRELRLKQEYFFVSASLQDILRRHLAQGLPLFALPDKVAIQLNDTHPAIAIPEWMRLLIDHHGLDFDAAWDITVRTFAYTNHTLLPEALETWPVALLEATLPRHLSLIYEINQRFLDGVRHSHPGDVALIRRLSLIDEDHGRRVRMAHLAFLGSHRVNGVAHIHTELMKSTIFADFHALFPERIVNKTNGITPRRWLHQANQGLSRLITAHIGADWVADLESIRQLVPLAEDAGFREDFRAVKTANKLRLAQLTAQRLDLVLNPASLFDVQVKRIHEYKRQLLNLLHVVVRYNRLRRGDSRGMVPRTVIFAGKAAPGYAMAKQIIRLINDVARVVNHDPRVQDWLKVAFIPDYNVSLAEVIIPAAELSEQISTAGTEASGTGNMKLALNGALTIGTRDGANIEIKEEVGEENIFFFGLTAEEVAILRQPGAYDPPAAYRANPELREALDMIGGGFFSPQDPGRYRDVVASLLEHGDHFCLLADFAAYVACQESVDAAWSQPEDWTQRAILNVARMGKFSADLTVLDYAREIWNIHPSGLAPDLPAR